VWRILLRLPRGRGEFVYDRACRADDDAQRSDHYLERRASDEDWRRHDRRR
jgi:hypothetical protein